MTNATMVFTRSVKRHLPKQGRPKKGTIRVDSTRFSLTVPTEKDKQLETIAALMGTNRHALAAALVLHGLERLELDITGEEAVLDAIRMD